MKFPSPFTSRSYKNNKKTKEVSMNDSQRMKNYYLERLDQIRDERLGYHYENENSGVGYASLSNEYVMLAKLNLFKQGRFKYKEVDVTQLPVNFNFYSTFDIFVEFDSKDIQEEQKRITEAAKVEDKRIEIRTKNIISIYFRLKDRFMFMKLSPAEMYDDIQYFINVDVDNGDISNLKVALPVGF